MGLDVDDIFYSARIYRAVPWEAYIASYNALEDSSSDPFMPFVIPLEF
jgi:hypothetical protein